MTIAIKQSIDALSQFNGAAPTTTPVTTNGVEEYPSDTVGGLFDPDAATAPTSILEIQIKLGGQSAWALVILDGTDTFPVASGSTEASYLYHPDNPLYLLPGQKLKLTTTGASTAMFATVIFAPSALGQ